jgi:hypothetical protein
VQPSDGVLFKDPPPKEECPICFLTMPKRYRYSIFCCVSLPPAALSSVPIYDFSIANEGLANEDMEIYYTCFCRGCVYSVEGSCIQTGNREKCPFCNSDQGGKTDKEMVEELMKRVDLNDCAIYLIAYHYENGIKGLQQDRTKAMELYARAAVLGCSKAHNYLGLLYR